MRASLLFVLALGASQAHAAEPDLVVLDITEVERIGGTVTVVVEIANIGVDAAADDAICIDLFPGGENPPPIGTMSSHWACISQLAPGQSHEHKFFTPVAPNDLWHALVDTEDRIAETDEANNTLTVALP